MLQIETKKRNYRRFDENKSWIIWTGRIKRAYIIVLEKREGRCIECTSTISQWSNQVILPRMIAAKRAWNSLHKRHPREKRRYCIIQCYRNITAFTTQPLLTLPYTCSSDPFLLHETIDFGYSRESLSPFPSLAFSFIPFFAKAFAHIPICLWTTPLVRSLWVFVSHIAVRSVFPEFYYTNNSNWKSDRQRNVIASQRMQWNWYFFGQVSSHSKRRVQKFWKSKIPIAFSTNLSTGLLSISLLGIF